MANTCQCQHKNQKFSLFYNCNYCTDCKEFLDDKCEFEDCTACRKRPEVAPDDLDVQERQHMAHVLSLSNRV